MNIKKVKYDKAPKLEPRIDGHKFRIVDNWRIYINGMPLDIPENFWTDFASTGVISPLNKTLYPAITHDYLYYKQVLFGRNITQKDADIAFLIAMKECKVNIIKRRLYYWGVRIGGKKTWNKYKNDRIKNKGEK